MSTTIAAMRSVPVKRYCALAAVALFATAASASPPIPDPAAPATAKFESRRQVLAGDHLYMIGNAGNAGNENHDFAAARSVMPLFDDGFENLDISHVAER